MSSQSLASPDGNWLATASFTHLQDGYRVQLAVTSQDGSIIWSPVLFVGDGEGYAYPFPEYWSPDSRYFYFDERLAGGSCDFFPLSSGWTRIDVKTGKLTEYPLPYGRDQAISQDGSLLAYASPGAPNAVIIRDLATNGELSVQLPLDIRAAATAQAGNFIWNPESSAIAFTTATSDFCAERPPSFQVFRLDIESERLTPLISPSDVLIRPTFWNSAGPILVKDWDSRSWWIDDTSGHIIPAPHE